MTHEDCAGKTDKSRGALGGWPTVLRTVAGLAYSAACLVIFVCAAFCATVEISLQRMKDESKNRVSSATLGLRGGRVVLSSRALYHDNNNHNDNDHDNDHGT